MNITEQRYSAAADTHPLRVSAVCIIILSLMLLASGCGSSAADGNKDIGSHQAAAPTGVAEVLQAGMESAAAESSAANAADEVPEETKKPSSSASEDTEEESFDLLAATESLAESQALEAPLPSEALPEWEELEALAANPEEGIDIDLTKLSSVLVYSQVYEIMYAPEDFVGKTIRMQGTYSSYYDEGTDTLYNACIIRDATACCAQGIEFVLTDDYAYPEDYPKDGDEVTVTGVFDIYEEDQLQYTTLRNSRLS